MIMKKLFMGLVFASLLLVGCAKTSYEPVEVQLGKDSCYTCHMGIENVEASTQAILEDGTPRIFDDIGCMTIYLQETQDKVKVSYVHDYQTKQWIEFNQAYFVHEASIETPMSYGLIAFGSEEEATRYLKESGGELMSSQELLQVDIKALKQEHSGHGSEAQPMKPSH